MKNENSFDNAMKKLLMENGCKNSETFFVLVDTGNAHVGASNCSMMDLSFLITHGLAAHMDLMLRGNSYLAENADKLLSGFENILYDAIALVADTLRLKWVEKVEFANGLHGFIKEIEEAQWFEGDVRCNDEYELGH